MAAELRYFVLAPSHWQIRELYFTIAACVSPHLRGISPKTPSLHTLSLKAGGSSSPHNPGPDRRRRPSPRCSPQSREPAAAAPAVFSSSPASAPPRPAPPEPPPWLPPPWRAGDGAPRFAAASQPRGGRRPSAAPSPAPPSPAEGLPGRGAPLRRSPRPLSRPNMAAGPPGGSSARTTPGLRAATPSQTPARGLAPGTPQHRAPEPPTCTQGRATPASTPGARPGSLVG